MKIQKNVIINCMNINHNWLELQNTFHIRNIIVAIFIFSFLQLVVKYDEKSINQLRVKKTEKTGYL